ncbi:MAG TPA: hypothetical protein ENJ56_00265 [Anaerolineae bacterium]|nr:hypothetical protein [Anaerolineae bacterium]
MNLLTKAAITLIALVFLGIGGFVLAYDWLFEVLPPSITLRLPNLDPPVTESLPAPAIAPAVANLSEPIVIPGLADPTKLPTPIPPTATATLAPTATTSHTETVVEPTETSIPPTATAIPPTPTPTPIPLPSAYLIDGIVNVPQSFNNCGPANLSIVLSYFNDDTTQATAADYLKPNPNDRNVSPWQINDYVNGQTGLRSTAHSGGTLEIIKALVAQGLPVVIERGADFNNGEGWYGHYLTVYGYDDSAETLIAMDTYGEGGWSAEGRVLSYAEIEETWKHFNYTFYVVYPEAQEAKVLEILGPTLTDKEAMWMNTIERAQAEIAEDNADKWAWFNLGTSYTSLGVLMQELGEPDQAQLYYEQGAAAYDQARSLDLPWRMLWYQQRPYMAYFRVGRYQDVLDLANATLETRGGQNVEETFYWKGNALSSMGDARGAGEAYRAALKVNSNFYYAQLALDYLTRDGG